MKLLSLSTAEAGCSLAIVDGSNLVCEEFWTNKLTHSRRILKMIEHMLEKRACVELDDIDGFIAAKGPGSFTGLRIGISVIKGMAQALDKPATGVSSLDGIAFRFQYSPDPVCIMMDARRDEVYCALYEFEQGRLVSKSSEMVVGPEKAIEMTKSTTLFAGSGSKAYKSIIEQKADNPIIAHDFQDHVSAVAMIQSLNIKDRFLYGCDTMLTPSYIRKSDAQLQFAQKKSSEKQAY
ncbi:MAG: tRNA (adenosine(37)-N6)-threonylcarbamoyltransferase complex dimerization subunit type 1 TsaB [Desulfobacula sp.]|nr:tRNA (adenosine(37)-N6)-threonylcarbamoyltransferase complex dimerization subunit type 1 TsaB [Desulfobacula sp.]